MHSRVNGTNLSVHEYCGIISGCLICLFLFHIGTFTFKKCIWQMPLSRATKTYTFYTTEQLRIKSIAQEPSSSSLPVLGPKLNHPVVQHLDHRAKPNTAAVSNTGEHWHVWQLKQLSALSCLLKGYSKKQRLHCCS